jgi:hypothetical protein
VTIGKLSYMAPEQAEGKDVDARADVFALGVTIWETLTIRSLIPPDDPAAAANLLRSGEFLPPSTWNPEVSPALDAIVMGCLRIDPEQRTPSAQQVAQDLHGILHERAPGYGRQQLARTVQWLFPERGWELLPEPERPPAQPSPDERASMVPVTPAAVAVARQADAQHDHRVPPGGTAPAGPERTSVPPEIPAVATGRHPMPAAAPAVITGAHPPVAAPPPPRSSVPTLAIGVLIGAGGMIALGVVIGAIGLALSAPSGSEQPPAGQAAPVLSPTAPSVTFTSAVPGMRLFLGPRELGPTPVRLAPHELTGEPLVAIAPRHQPAVIRAERLFELSRAIGRVHEIDLEPSQRPDVMVYVRYDGQGTAHVPSGDDLGPVPGVVRVPTRRDVPTPDRIVIFDELGQHSVSLSLEGCEPDKVCVVYAGSGS